MSINSDKKAAIITGASSGIGREFALALARESFETIYLTARRRERLEGVKEEILELRSSRGLAPLSVQVLPCDLRQREQRESLVSEILRYDGAITMLINNAGFGSLGRFADSEVDWEQNMIRVNCEAPVHLTRSFLNHMQETSLESRIINVCSTAAFQPMPQMATYAATKAFLLSFSQAIAQELSSTKVRVLAHCPGPTDSEFHQVVGLPEKLSFIPGMSAQEVVTEALQAATSGRRVFINGWGNAVLAQLARLLPSRVTSFGIERLLMRVKP